MADSRFNERLSQMTTCWSLVFRAHQGPTEAVSAAQQDLLLRYGGAILRYLLTALRDPDAAQEVAQQFAYCFVRGDFRGADPRRGRFRDLVKTVLFHRIVDYHRQRRKQDRLQPLPPDLPAPTSGPDAADREFVERCREELLGNTWEELRGVEQQTGRPPYTVLRTRVDYPGLTSDQLAEQLGSRLGQPLTAAGLRQTLHRARLKFAALLVAEVGRSLEDAAPDRVEQELMDLDLLEYCRPALRRSRGS
jgi:RNA polymerase sigma-70 factor (ECF subfamily)